MTLVCDRLYQALPASDLVSRWSLVEQMILVDQKTNAATEVGGCTGTGRVKANAPADPVL